MRRRGFWRTCANCSDVAHGCLCWSCLRAAVVPLVLAELVRRALS